MSAPRLSRREFLALSCLAFSDATASSWIRRAPRRGPLGPHPTPRPGIDASHVLKDDAIKGGKDVIAAFNDVRQIPQIVDGIRCQCGCAKHPEFYSLLSCYEGPKAMAQTCETCQAQGRYVFELHTSNKSLDEIRAAIEERYGS